MTNSRVEGSSGRAARKLRFALMGPAFIAAIGYIDPGNFATNIQAGASFGYKLLWVVVWANLMAMLIQMLSAKLGIATGKNLAEQIRDHYPRPAVWLYWVQAEIIAMATDLAEFIGAAIGFKLILASRCFRRGAHRDCHFPDPDAAASRSKTAGKSYRWAAAVCGGGLYRRADFLSAESGTAQQRDDYPEPADL